MSKKYQQKIVELAKVHVEALESSDFIYDFDIKNLKLVEERFCDELTKKFIEGKSLDNFCFTDEEYSKLLKEIVAKDVFHGLKEKGVIGSYSDDDTEEVFFLTKMGKKFFKNIKKDI